MAAQAGHDVWLANSRGNTYSRRHTNLNPDEDSEFWNFSWEEIGKYDVPAVIDYILEISSYEKVTYIGH
jgi:hypothetical protein